MEETNSRPLHTGRTNNGSRHRVRPLHGGNGKIPGGRPKIQKVKEEARQSLGKERGDPLLTVLWRNPQTNGFQEFILFCYRLDRLQLTAVYCNRRVVWDELAQAYCTYRLTPEERRRFKGQWYLTLNKACKNGLMKLRSDFRAAVSMKNRLHHESGEQTEEPIHPGQQRRIQHG